MEYGIWRLTMSVCSRENDWEAKMQRPVTDLAQEDMQIGNHDTGLNPKKPFLWAGTQPDVDVDVADFQLSVRSWESRWQRDWFPPGSGGFLVSSLPQQNCPACVILSSFDLSSIAPSSLLCCCLAFSSVHIRTGLVLTHFPFSLQDCIIALNALAEIPYLSFLTRQAPGPFERCSIRSSLHHNGSLNWPNPTATLSTSLLSHIISTKSSLLSSSISRPSPSSRRFSHTTSSRPSILSSRDELASTGMSTWCLSCSPFSSIA